MIIITVGKTIAMTAIRMMMRMITDYDSHQLEKRGLI